MPIQRYPSLRPNSRTRVSAERNPGERGGAAGEDPGGTVSEANYSLTSSSTQSKVRVTAFFQLR